MSEAKIKSLFRQYMLALWEEGEGFSGKRPLGDSGWESEIRALLPDDKFTHAEKNAEVRRIIKGMK